MSLIGKLQKIIDEARHLHEVTKADDNADKSKFELILQSGSENGNMLVRGDNLKFIKHMDRTGYTGKVKLIYIDPPFFSKANYDAVIKIDSDMMGDMSNVKLYAYHDTWESGMEEYLQTLCVRLLAMRDLLSEDGCIWVHLDWHVVHYVKIIMDEIFGEKNFINEIIWNYKSGGTSKRHFSKKHDTLLFYSKSNKYYFKPQAEKSYNREFKEYRFKGVQEYKDDIGWYTMVNMKDVWQIDMVGRTSAERTGYATQKPEVLIERIVESCSKEGDVCVDFFGGSGTLASVCHKMGRKWISCDLSQLAFSKAAKRLIELKADFAAFEQTEADNQKSSFEIKNRKNKMNCKINVDISINPLDLSNKNLLKIKLISYYIDVKKLALDESAEKAVKKVVKSDSLSLIDYWSVDFNFDGKVHKPEMILISSKDKIYECEQIGNAFGSISVQVADVFGNNTFSVVSSEVKISEKD